MEIAMRKTILSTLLASVGLAAATAAYAIDGTITFTGNVIASTCEINGSNDVDVVLPTIGTTALTSVGAVGGRTPFALSLKNCPYSEAAPMKVGVWFEPGANVNMTTGHLTVGTGDAKNVEVQILNDQHQPIKIGASVSSQNSQMVSIGSDKTAQLNYFGEYYATGTVEPGSVKTNVQYSLVYQ